MIIIAYDNTICTVDKCPADVSMALYEGLKYHPDGYEHVYKFKSGNWNGYNYLFSPKTNTFRRGLLAKAMKIISELGHTVRTVDLTKDTEVVSMKSKMGNVRPYQFQSDAVDSVDKSDVGLIVSPTGSGKSVIIAKVIERVCRRTLVLVTDVVLLDQMQQSLQRLYDQPIGMVGDGEFDLQDITVSTIQSLASILKPKAKKNLNEDKYRGLVNHIKQIGMVVSDEAHLADSDSFGLVMPMFQNTKRFYGLSATPYGWADKAEKRQNLELEQHFGSLIFDGRKNDFILLGLKSPLNVLVSSVVPANMKYMNHVKKMCGKPMPDHGKNYREALECEILNNDSYKHIVAATAMDQIGAGKSVFVHAIHSIQYGEDLQAMIPGSMLVNGSTSRKERRIIYDALRAKEILAIVSDVGGTGLDIPSLDTIILASDVVDVRQIKGRVERAAANKTCGTLIDFDIDTQFLGKHHETRLSQYKHDNNKVGTL